MFSNISTLTLVNFVINTLYALLGLIMAGIVFRLVDKHLIKEIDTIAELKRHNVAVGTVVAGYIIGISILISRFLG